MTKFVPFLILVLGLSGCGSLSKTRHSNLVLVRVGQTQQELVTVLGKPGKEIKNGNNETWLYDVYSDDNSRTYPYNAKFEKGILVSFDADSRRGVEDGELRQKRRESIQEITNNRSNNSPPIKEAEPSSNGQ